MRETLAEREGVPLAAYMDPGGLYGVRFECEACLDSFDVDVDRVVRRLRAAGLGDETTGVRAVGRLARKACGRCGTRRWATRPAHHPRPPRTRMIP